MAVVVLLIVLLSGGSGKSSAVAVTKAACKAMTSGNVSDVYDLVHPAMIEAHLKAYGMTEKEMKQEIKETEQSAKAAIKALKASGQGFSVDYDIVKEEHVDKDELMELAEDYREDFNLEITDAACVEVKLTVKMAGNTEDEENDFVAVKIGGKWYLDPDKSDLF